MTGTIELVGFYNLIVGALYVYVGLQISKREVPDAARLAHRMFLTWWYALGSVSLIGALNIGLYRVGALHPVYFTIIGQINLLAIVVALLGLLYYMVYIYTGSGKWFKPIIGFYAVFYLLLVALVVWLWSPATDFTDDGWNIVALPESEQELSPVMGLVFVVLLVGPQLAAAIGFIRLGSKLEDVTQRYRVRMVGTAILIWFGLSLVGSLGTIILDEDLTSFDAWQYTQRIIGLGAVLTILAAYKPPKWIQQKFGVTPV